MAYLMLYGPGWTQRWAIENEYLDAVRTEIDRVGRPETGHLRVLDPGTGEPTTLVIAWHQVVAAVVLGKGEEGADSGGGSYR